MNNVIKEKNVLRIVAILLFSFLSFHVVKADTLLKDINTGIFETVSQGAISDSEYSFSISLTDETTVEFWGYDGTILLVESKIKDGQRIQYILPTDYELSGNIGCYIYNVGTYNGKSVNLKCTFDWEQIIDENGVEIYPAIGVNLFDKNRTIGFDFSTIGYGVTFEVVDENMSPLNLNMTISIGDIDQRQYFGFKVNSGQIKKIQCRDDSIIYYEYLNELHWFYSDETASADGLESVARIETENMTSFYIWFGAEGDKYSKSYFKGYRVGNTDEVLESSLNKKINEMNTLDTSKSYGWGWGYFNGVAFGPYEVSTPIKYVSDDDELKNENNTISKSEVFYYDLYEFVPLESSTYYYDKFVITDTISDSLTYISSEIYDNAGNDVTSDFTITIDNNVLTAIANDTTSSDFYNNTYQLRIYVKFNEDILALSKTSGINWKYENGVYTITNNATVSVIKNEETITKDSNKVTTEYVRESLVIVKYVDKYSNKEIAESKLIEGYVGKEYVANAQTIDGYKLFSQYDKITGEMTEDTIVVTFYYIKQSNVNVKYVNYYTKKEIEASEEISGLQGNKYITIAKDIEGYKIVSIPENAIGIYSDETIEVIYEYKKIGTIIVKFIDTDGNEILDRVVNQDFVDDEYYFEAPEIDGYTVVSDKEIKATYIDGELIFVIEYEKDLVLTGDISPILLSGILIICVFGIFFIKKLSY